MAAIDIIEISREEVVKIARAQEDHFHDVKAMEIAPSKLTPTLSAFANATGGELFIGISEVEIELLGGKRNDEEDGGVLRLPRTQMDISKLLMIYFF